MNQFAFPNKATLILNGISAALLLTIVAAVWITRAPKPPLGSVDGVYVNACCVPIRLSHGILAVGSQRVPFTLERMKFGLIAQPVRTITIRDGHSIVVINERWPSGILFDETQLAFTLTSERVNADYRFTRR